MKLVRLVKMIRKDIRGAEGWPVYFGSFEQNAAGEWHEVEDAREPITAVEVEEPDEILLITDSDGLPLTLAGLEEELARLMPRLREYTVDCCETLSLARRASRTTARRADCERLRLFH